MQEKREGSPAGAPPVTFERRSAQRSRSRGRTALSTPVITLSVQVVDMALLLLAGMVAGAVLPPSPNATDHSSLVLAGVVASVATVVGLTRGKAYAIQSLGSVPRQVSIGSGAAVVGAAASILLLFLMRNDEPRIRVWPFVWLLTGSLLFLLSRYVLSHLVKRWTDSGLLARRVAVVGTGEFSRKFIERLREEPNAYTFVGLYDDRRLRRVVAPDGGAIEGKEETVRGTVADLLARSRQERIDVIAIALPLEAVARIQKILDQLRSAVADVCLTTGLAGLQYTSGKVSAVGANPVILISERPFKDWSAVSKTAFDVVLASILLLALSPLLALVALLIKLDSPGPVLFRQPRRGFNHQLFACFKFRTMRVETTDMLADMQTTRNDPRVTRVGRWLRRSSLDELPQLLNVLRGEMSLVGPTAACAEYEGGQSAVRRCGLGVCDAASGEAGDHGLGAGKRLAGRDPDSRAD